MFSTPLRSMCGCVFFLQKMSPYIFFPLLAVKWGRVWFLQYLLFLSHSGNVYFFSFSFNKYLQLWGEQCTFQFINSQPKRWGEKKNFHKPPPLVKANKVANKASGLCKSVCLRNTARWEVNAHSFLILKSTCIQQSFVAHLSKGCDILCQTREGYTEGKALPQRAYNLGGKITTYTWISKLSHRGIADQKEA